MIRKLENSQMRLKALQVNLIHTLCTLDKQRQIELRDDNLFVRVEFTFPSAV